MEKNFNNALELFKSQDEIVGLTVGNSMLPLFRSDKDMAVVKKITAPLKVNDVLLYRKKNTDSEFILHRLIKITPSGYIIRGDNLYANETDVSKSDIIGVLKGFYRNAKYYDCEKSIKYKVYCFYIKYSYPVRFFLRKVRVTLSKIKRRIIIKK